MNKTEPKYRRPLNAEQIQILEILYKFRFVSAAQLKKYFAKSNPGMNVFRRLEILERQGFIAKRYFDNYRLLHKPVAYYLQPSGVRKLHESRDAIFEVNVKAIYKDKSVSEQFIQDCFDIFSIYLALRSSTNLKFFTKMDLNCEDYEYFPKPLPDAYIKLQNDKHFFLQMHHAHQPFFVAKRAVARYVDYFENGVWDDTGTAFPAILFVVDSANVQKRLHEFLVKSLEDIKVYTALGSGIVNGRDSVWNDTEELNMTYSLMELGDIETA